MCLNGYDQMKLVVGMGSIDDYIPLAKAGADEVFVGYVPHWWEELTDGQSPVNRREVRYYNVQIGSKSELEILKKLKEQYQVPVTITLNSLTYDASQYPLLLRLVKECMELDFSTFIVADPALILYLSQASLEGLRLHLSGEVAELNRHTIALFASFGMQRVIYSRKTGIQEMKSCNEANEISEREAFLLNEKCHFSGCYCHSMHCDELAHCCHLPYQIRGVLEARQYQICKKENAAVEDRYLPGRSGCGLCALWSLLKAGITHLKIVSRGNYSEDTIEDVKAARKALQILEESRDEAEYKRKMKQEIFAGDCSGNCYYE